MERMVTRSMAKQNQASNVPEQLESLMIHKLYEGICHGISIVNYYIIEQQAKLRAAVMPRKLYEASMEAVAAFCDKQKAIGQKFAFNNGLDWNYIVTKVDRDFSRYSLLWDSEHMCWKN